MPGDLFSGPTAGQLVEAVREFLESLGEDISPERAFHLRVAVNALQIVERELATSTQAEDGHRRRLAALGFSGDQDLAQAIRAGTLLPERNPEILASVLADVEARLAVNSPHHASRYGETSEEA